MGGRGWGEGEGGEGGGGVGGVWSGGGVCVMCVCGG